MAIVIRGEIPCGCKIGEVDPGIRAPEARRFAIEYCPQHNAAAATHEASVWALAYLQQGCDGPKDNDYYYTVDLLKAAIAWADGKEIT
jgi:hypothetical protein